MIASACSGSALDVVAGDPVELSVVAPELCAVATTLLDDEDPSSLQLVPTRANHATEQTERTNRFPGTTMGEVCPAGVAHLLLDVGITNVWSQARPIGVDEADAPPGTHDTNQFGDHGRGIGNPLQHTLAPRGIEPVVRLGEPACVANRELRRTTRRPGPSAGDCDHLLAEVDLDDLTGRAEIVGGTEHRVPQSASDIDQALTAPSSSGATDAQYDSVHGWTSYRDRCAARSIDRSGGIERGLHVDGRDGGEAVPASISGPRHDRVRTRPRGSCR